MRTVTRESQFFAASGSKLALVENDLAHEQPEAPVTFVMVDIVETGKAPVTIARDVANLTAVAASDRWVFVLRHAILEHAGVWLGVVSTIDGGTVKEVATGKDMAFVAAVEDIVFWRDQNALYAAHAPDWKPAPIEGSTDWLCALPDTHGEIYATPKGVWRRASGATSDLLAPASIKECRLAFVGDQIVLLSLGQSPATLLRIPRADLYRSAWLSMPRISTSIQQGNPSSPANWPAPRTRGQSRRSA